MKIIEAEQLTVRAGSRTILERVSFAIQPGEWVALAGPSGSGKSRLLTALLGFSRDRTGSINVCGRSPAVGAHPPRTGFYQDTAAVFQENALVDELTVSENLQLAGAAEKDIPALLENVGIDPGDAAKLPSSLSGGMARRVSLARALARPAKLLVLDEPLAGVDEKTRTAIVERLLQLRTEQPDLAAILVAHELEVLASLCDRALVIDPAAKQLNDIPLDRNNADDSLTTLQNALTTQPTSIDTQSSTPAPQPSTLLRESTNALRTLQEAVYLLPRLLTSLVAGLANPRTPEFALRYGYLSLPFVFGVCLIIGLSLVIQSEAVLAPFRQQTRLPEAMVKAVIEGFGPLLIALLMAGRAGSSLSGETGLKRLSRQWEALWLCGRDADRELFGPRAAGLVIALPVLTLAGITASLFSGALYYRLHSAGSLTDRYYITDVIAQIHGGAIAEALLKSIVFGIGIAVCAYTAGRRAPTSSSDVAESSTLATTLAATAVILIDFVFRFGV